MDPITTKTKRKGEETTISAGSVRIHQPDSAWAWFICILALTSSIVILGFLFSFGILNPVFLEEFHEGKARTGIVLYFIIFHCINCIVFFYST